MKMKSELIKYNIGQRGRKLIGQERGFNIPKVVELINSDRVQELVNAGDMYGYLGHGVRSDWGLNPDETVLSGSAGAQKYVVVEPAIRTIHIKAYDDGTIEHQAEFLDNELGRKAYEWYKARIGGFSSVFAPSPQNPTSFYGFDYVMVPNFATNRGYDMVADSVNFDIDRLTSKQKADWLKARDIERRVVMDSVRSRLVGLASDLEIADQVVQIEQQQKKELAAVLDDALFRLRDAEHKLAKFDVKPEPMLKLSIGEDNWIAKNATPAVMDSLKGFIDEKASEQIKNEQAQNYSPIDYLLK